MDLTGHLRLSAPEKLAAIHHIGKFSSGYTKNIKIRSFSPELQIT